MNLILGAINELLRPLFDLMLLPFQQLHPMVGLTTVSLGCAVLMLLGYRATSNQPAIERVKRKIAAGLFEIRLFNDDIVAILKAQGGILRNNITYLGLNLVPMVFMILPFVLVIAQLQFHYGYRGLTVGERTILQVGLAEEADTSRPPQVTVTLPTGLRLDSPRVWIPTRNQLAWRLVADSTGEFEVEIKLAGQRVTKQIVVSDSIVRRSPYRLKPSFLNLLLYPAEASLPAESVVTEVEVLYPTRAVGLFGFETDWLIVFFILTIGFAFTLKGRFGVTI